jgi:hypothetical protein
MTQATRNLPLNGPNQQPPAKPVAWERLLVRVALTYACAAAEIRAEFDGFMRTLIRSSL